MSVKLTDHEKALADGAHGGRVAAAARAFGGDDWIDLSTCGPFDATAGIPHRPAWARLSGVPSLSLVSSARSLAANTVSMSSRQPSR